MKKFLIAALFVCAVSWIAVEAKTKPAGAGKKVTITITNFNFTPKTLTVARGTTVVFYNKEGRHTVESDSGAFKSDVLTADKSFEFTFTKAGKYAYHCGFHGDTGGKDMAGTIIVK
ncbi:MAG: cupredoxin domain-containing protein [Acidobacteriota bacterium]